MAKDLSSIAKRRLGGTKAERSEKMRKLAVIKYSKLSKKEKMLHSKKMHASRYNKK